MEGESPTLTYVATFVIQKTCVQNKQGAAF